MTSLFHPLPGTYVFRYSLTAGSGDWKSAKAYRTGMAFNNPLLPIGVVDAVSRKSLPQTQSLVSMTAGNVVISTLKKAEAGSDVVIRLYEIEGTPAESAVEMLGRRQRVRDVNLLEEESTASDQQTVRARPYEIRTIKLLR